jgi:hypothetical protein
MTTLRGWGALALAIVVSAWVPRVAFSHCDTLDGPVVADARQALEKGDPAPVLKWVRKEDETEIRDAFAKTLAVRGKGPEAKELADRWFFETLVRVHRAGEGASYTGLKPAGVVEPAVAAADKALEAGSVEDLAKEVAAAAEKGIRERFARAAAKKAHAGHTVEAGREFVEAYIEYVHYVELLHGDVTGAAHHPTGAEGGGGESAHRH